jgi:hypothetical protein
MRRVDAILRLTPWVRLTVRVDGYGLHTIEVATDVGSLGSLDIAIKRTTDAADRDRSDPVRARRSERSSEKPSRDILDATQ